MKKLFGTDGIRGVAGVSPLTPKEVHHLGRVAAYVLHRHAKKGRIRVLIVRDTRASGEGLVRQLAKGLMEQGVDVYDGGVLCTPAVACLVQKHRFHSGVVVSASHNPPKFNGIKFFNSQGRKWADSWEHRVEDTLLKKRPIKVLAKKGVFIKATEFREDYKTFLFKTLPRNTDFSRLRVAVDCSHGANHQTAPDVFRKLNASLTVIGNKPTGHNINVNCGSQHTQKLADRVRKKRCHIGVAFDGDGDRVIFVDEKGREVDGDFVIGLFAKVWKAQKKLTNHKAVITVMANLGLKKALKRLGVKPIETPVGDRWVSEAMVKNNSVLGGEQSGHIILGAYLPSGDGLLTALHVLSILSQSKKPFSSLVSWMKKYPQVLINIPVKEKIPIPQLNGVEGKIKEIENELADNGRILVRYSGTEPLLRIMIEGPSRPVIQRFAKDLVNEVQSAMK